MCAAAATAVAELLDGCAVRSFCTLKGSTAGVFLRHALLCLPCCLHCSARLPQPFLFTQAKPRLPYLAPARHVRPTSVGRSGGLGGSA